MKMTINFKIQFETYSCHKNLQLHYCTWHVSPISLSMFHLELFHTICTSNHHHSNILHHLPSKRITILNFQIHFLSNVWSLYLFFNFLYTFENEWIFTRFVGFASVTEATISTTERKKKIIFYFDLFENLILTKSSEYLPSMEKTVLRLIFLVTSIRKSDHCLLQLPV